MYSTLTTKDQIEQRLKELNGMRSRDPWGNELSLSYSHEQEYTLLSKQLDELKHQSDIISVIEKVKTATKAEIEQRMKDLGQLVSYNHYTGEYKLSHTNQQEYDLLSVKFNELKHQEHSNSVVEKFKTATKAEVEQRLKELDGMRFLEDRYGTQLPLSSLDKQEYDLLSIKLNGLKHQEHMNSVVEQPKITTKNQIEKRIKELDSKKEQVGMLEWEIPDQYKIEYAELVKQLGNFSSITDENIVEEKDNSMAAQMMRWHGSSSSTEAAVAPHVVATNVNSVEVDDNSMAAQMMRWHGSSSSTEAAVAPHVVATNVNSVEVDDNSMAAQKDAYQGSSSNTNDLAVLLATNAHSSSTLISTISQLGLGLCTLGLNITKNVSKGLSNLFNFTNNFISVNNDETNSYSEYTKSGLKNVFHIVENSLDKFYGVLDNAEQHLETFTTDINLAGVDILTL